jgi:GDPmannose 4,6-dehydratase
VARIKLGLQKRFFLGNLDAKRDWGHARDFVKAMWLMLQQDSPDDYVIATGESHSVREVVELAFKEVGVALGWRGKGVEEKGYVKDIDRTGLGEQSRIREGDVVAEIDTRYFRPTEVDSLLGDASKARERLGWEPKVSFSEMVSEMVREDLNLASRDRLCRDSGFRVMSFRDD